MRPSSLEPNDLLLFARVADLGSFSRAAERLGMPKSTVSRRVSALESQLGERLLVRSTRKLSVTEFGQAVLAHARHVAEDVEAAASLAQNRQVAPSGTLRITMPPDLAHTLLWPMLANFTRAHPAIALEIDLSARFVDLIGENYDLAIRPGTLRDDASLAARRLATFSLGLYASPEYLERRGKPRAPADLAQHDGLMVLSRTGDAAPWVLFRGDERWQGMPRARALVNSPDVLMRMALRGAGIAVVNDHFAVEHLKHKALVAVLPAWRPQPVPLWAVFPGRRLMPAKTRVFIDALMTLFTSPECQAIEREARTQRASASESPDEPAKVTRVLQRQRKRTRAK
jgi:DNA-binding transcriptional LysR family regulator